MSVGSDSATPSILSESMNGIERYTTPFPYAVVDDFFPADTYAALVKDWSKAMAGGGFGAAARQAELVEQIRGSDSHHPDNPTWASVAQALRHPDFVTKLLTGFSETIDEHSAQIASDDFAPGFRLYACRDSGVQEALGVHLDAVRKLFTIVVYMEMEGETSPSSYTSWGTALFHDNESGLAPVTFDSSRNYEGACVVPFKPNRAFLMPNSARALHGVVGGEANVDRRTIMCGYWAFGAE